MVNNVSLENMNFRKKFALIIFLLSLIRRVYVCLTTESCKVCQFAARCEEESDELFNLVSAISMRVRRYIIKEV